MLATCPRVNRFPGAVPALLTWANGESERLPDFVATACEEATSLLHVLVEGVETGNAPNVRAAARRLHALLGHFGVPQLCTTADTIEDFARMNDLGAAAPLVEELGAVLPGFCAYLAKKPWLRC